MKTLNLTQMENLQGGITGRQCMLAGAGLVLAIGMQLWGPAIGIGVASADCW